MNVKASSSAPGRGAVAETMSEALLGEREAARLLNLSPRTLQARRVTGGGPRFIKLGRAVRYRRADLEAFVEKGAVQSTTEADAQKRGA